MSSFEKTDLRSIKTERALYSAMFTLLESQNFKKITVKSICEASLISRAAFYAHFIDKYDLLKYCIFELWEKQFGDNFTFEALESAANSNLHKNTKIIKNLIFDADAETLDILYDFIVKTQKLDTKTNQNKKDYVTMMTANFYAGGLISYLSWQIKHDFPPEVPLVNRQIYDMINKFKQKN